MKCSSCGALVETGSEKCNDCETPVIESARIGLGNAGSAEQTDLEGDTLLSQAEQPDSRGESRTSKLIEFPGVSRTSIPQWRKELSERVREVQEKRAREDALEGNREAPAVKQDPAVASPQLELLPHTEAPLNPLVAAALRRIERAHETNSHYMHSPNNGAAVAYAEQPVIDDTEFAGLQIEEFEASDESRNQLAEELIELTQPEKVHNLVVVPPLLLQSEEDTQLRLKPRRMISGDLNDPALNYLDSILQTTPLETTVPKAASNVSRLLSAVADLIVVALLGAPIAAAWELANANWHDYRVVIAVGAGFAIISFLYFTISTGLTGQTMGMRLFSLKIVDSRTGLIPTGSQSAARALIYLLSLFTLGITSLYALLNPERQTAHDRITRTAVIHS